MKKLALPLIVGLSALLLSSAGRITPAGGTGKEIFLKNKCSKCHTITSQGLDREGPAPTTGKLPPDLSGVGLKHTSDWMVKWLHKEEEMNGKKHLKKFSGPDDELESLTKWLATLKKK